jgi:hypothetical protein
VSRRTIFSHGKYMDVISSEPDPPTGRRRDKKSAFAMVSLAWMINAAKMIGAPDAMLLVLLVYLTWETKSSTFILSNDRLKQCGVGRKTKYRVLTRLEKASIIRIERQGKRAPIVTLLMGSTSHV